MPRRQPRVLRKGSGGVRCLDCNAAAAADGKGTPIVLRHEDGCPQKPDPVTIALEDAIADEAVNNPEFAKAIAAAAAWDLLPLSELAVGDLIEDPGNAAAWTVNRVDINDNGTIAFSAGGGCFKRDNALPGDKFWILKRHPNTTTAQP